MIGRNRVGAGRGAIAVALASALILVLVVAARAPVAHAANHDIGIVDFAFQPAELTVFVGEPVTWTNSGSGSPAVTSDNATPSPTPTGAPTAAPSAATTPAGDRGGIGGILSTLVVVVLVGGVGTYLVRAFAGPRGPGTKGPDAKGPGAKGPGAKGPGGPRERRSR